MKIIRLYLSTGNLDHWNTGNDTLTEQCNNYTFNYIIVYSGPTYTAALLTNLSQ